MGNIASQSSLISPAWAEDRDVSQILQARECHKKYMSSKSYNLSPVGADCYWYKGTHWICLAQFPKSWKCKENVCVITFRLNGNQNVDFL